MAQPALHTKGLDEFVADLKALGREWSKELAKTHRQLGREVAAEARQFAIGSGPVQAHFASLITGRGTAAEAAVGVGSKGNAAIWGAKARTGWFAAGRYAGLDSNQPEYVGQTWDAGGPGGPYGINAAIRHDMPRIVDRYGDLIDALAGRAFPIH